jgi:hypothetical protein
MKSKLFGLLATGLVAMLTACPPPPTTPTLVFAAGGDTLTAGTTASPASPATYTVNATNVTGNVNWTLNPSTTGTLGAQTSAITSGVATVTYTPPNNLTTATNVTLTATSATTPTVTVQKVIAINPAGSTGITVAGKVFKWNNKVFRGVPIVVTDAGGNRQETTSSLTDGSFTIPNPVRVPYTISAVPERATDVAPISYDKVTISNPNLVLAKAGYSGLGGGGGNPGFVTEDCNNGSGRADAELYVTTNQPVAVNNRARVFFVGEGISFRPIESNSRSNEMINAVVNANLAANTTSERSARFDVKYDGDFCKAEIIGKLVYVERDNNGAGAVVKTGTADVTILSGNKVCVGTCPAAFGTSTPNLNIAPISPSSFVGTINFPQGITSATAFALVRYQNAPADVPAYFAIDQQVIQSTNPVFDLKIASFNDPKLSYRVGIVAISGAKINWIYSDITPPGKNDFILSLPSLGDTVSPPIGQLLDNSGTGAPFPTFQQRQVTGSNIYFRSFITLTGTNLWLAGSPLTDFKFPQIATPATLSYQQRFEWFAINSLTYRDANTTNASDIALGNSAVSSRSYGVLRNLYGISAFTEPDLISQGSINQTPTNTCIIAPSQSCP